jgi:Fe-S cluster assembly protein SufD
MSELDAARDRLLVLAERSGGRLGDAPAWLRSLRAEAAASFAAQGLPSTRQEEWRYTNVAALARIPLELPPEAAAPLDRSALEEACFPVFACGLYVFADGRFRPELSSPPALSGELRAASLAALRAADPESPEPHLGTLVDAKRNPFAALNAACLDDGAVLRVPRGIDVEQPIHLVFASPDTGAARVRHPRVLIVAEPGSRLRVIQDHVSLGGAGGFSNSVTEVSVGRDAQVDLVLLQREADDAFVVSNLAARLERDARFSCHTVSLGGRLVRNDLEVLLADEGAECSLQGLFVGGGEEVVDNHTLVDHAMPRGSSRELYKGILGGRSRGVFRGRVVVRPDAQKTDARQSNPNLLIGAGAEIDTKPQLEIHADDVKCSHGSSIGQLDEDSVFYVRSRGLSDADARDLLTRGFAREILAGLPVAALGEGLDELLARRLAAAARRPEP